MSNQETTESSGGILGDFGTALVRTVVPFIVGWLLALLASFEVVLPDGTEQSLTGLLTVLFGAVYYALVRWLERKVPALGWLIGNPRTPTYVAPTVVQGELADGDEDPDPPVDPTV